MKSIILALLMSAIIGAPPCFCAVSVTDGSDEGRACFVITNDNATFYFQKTAGGFSSLLDRDGNDWISHSSASGASGIYRGIPNLVHPGDVFHPGHDHCVSTLLPSTSTKVSIRSTSTAEGGWTAVWDFYSTHATMTVTQASRAYWFLYEGTPGGGYSGSNDYWMTPDGTKRSCATAKEGDLPASPGGTAEWICFGDNALGRVLFLAHHENDNQIDRYYEMSPMTVFGFGRVADYMQKKLTGQNTFTIGFAEATDLAAIANTVNSVIDGQTDAQITKAPRSGSLEICAAPNPFKGTVKIMLAAKEAPGRGGCALRIYDINGKLLSLINAERKTLEAGIVWNPLGQRSGIYLLKATINNTKLYKKLILTE